MIQEDRSVTVTDSPLCQNDPDIIVFDAVCMLCSANAQLVLRRDRTARFRLAAQQGEVGRALFQAAGMNPDDPESLVVVTGQSILRDSDAVIYIYRHLGWPWRIASLIRIFPKALRDSVYRLVARNRYRWFGRRSTCWMPNAADRERLL
jgi:predicted DCC family thiol-disulfide oxidoreductase YuxK